VDEVGRSDGAFAEARRYGCGVQVYDIKKRAFRPLLCNVYADNPEEDLENTDPTDDEEDKEDPSPRPPS